MNAVAPQAHRNRRLAAVSLAAAALLGATGCSAINPQATTMHYAASDGINVTVGETEFRNILLISAGEDQEGRYIGSVFNSSDEPVEAVMTVDGTSTRLSLDAGQTLDLEDEANAQTIPSTGTFAGGMTEGSFEAEGQTVEEDVPVLDGTLPEYREFVPGGADESATEHLYPTEEPAEGGH